MSRVIKFQFLYKGLPFSSTNSGLNWHKCVYSLDDVLGSSLYQLNAYHGSCELVAKRQFTGLFDLSSDEMYESDICRVEGLGNCIVSIDQYYGVVFIDKEGGETPVIDCIAEGDSFIIIGNWCS